MTIDILDISRQVAGELMRVWAGEGGAFIRTPVLYPGGSTVVVRIEPDGNQFFVSDMGGGYCEADLMSATSLYTRHARKVAKSYGVGFDSHSLFVLKVERDRLSGAVATIAACSQEAVQHISYRLATWRAKDVGERLHDRLVNVFSLSRVKRNPDIQGSTGNVHRFSSLVQTDGRSVIYEPVAAHASSINSAVTRFFDVSRLDDAPRRVAYVRNKEAFGGKLTLIATMASVVQEDAPDETIQRLAA